MLLNLHIKNMALIDEMDIQFDHHLNILTGETGAGKSIVIDSILLALGGKIPKDFVRKDAEYGLVELMFLVDDSTVLNHLRDMDIMELDAGELILSRKIVGNRNICKVNGETVTLTKVREIASLLLDLHAQHEHQSLLIPGNHIKLLDRYGKENIDSLKDAVSSLYKEYTMIKEELLSHTMNEEEKRRRLDLMEFERNEIANAHLSLDEDEQLENQYRKMSNSKNITESVTKAYQHVNDSAYEIVDRGVRELVGVASLDEELSSMVDMLTTVSDIMSDFSKSARIYLEENSFSEEDFRNIEDRLNQVNHLKAKYGKTIEDVLTYGEQLDVEYEKLLNQEQYVDELKARLAATEQKLEHASKELSDERKRVAKELVIRIKNALLDLNFLDVQFDMLFEKNEKYGSQGYDNSYFVISTNVGEEMKPLWQVASGGELSRIMLAMKSCLADVDNIETLIFDEIDVGISGRTAQMVAEKIHSIGKNHQVICITHLPQIAAMANQHYLIEKKVESGKTITHIAKLDQDAQILELARLIGGVKITDTVIKSAKEMKELATKAKVD